MTFEDRALAVGKKLFGHRFGEGEEDAWKLLALVDAISVAWVDGHNSCIECMQDQMEDAVVHERKAIADMAELEAQDEAEERHPYSDLSHAFRRFAAAIRARGNV